MIYHHEARGRCVSNTQGSVAQLVERATENRKVTGSTPVGATIRPPGFYSGGGFFFKHGLLPVHAPYSLMPALVHEPVPFTSLLTRFFI